MPKREVGLVTAVKKDGGSAEYQVRLPRGQIVIVPHNLLLPQRMTLLARGSRVLVTHQLGLVESATTDLAYSTMGEVKSLQGNRRANAYKVEIEQGGSILVQKSQVQAHPVTRDLIPGAVLEIQLEGEVVVGARLVRENTRVNVQRVDLLHSTVIVRGEQGDTYTIRLDAKSLRQVIVGEKLEIEITYAPDGQRKIGLQRAKEKQAPPPQPGKPQQSREPARTPPPAAPEDMIAGETVGLDPAALARVKREGHRFEIVSFLEKHARDGLIEWYRLKDGSPARYSQPKAPLSPLVQRAIRSALPEFRDFFQHQARALDSIRQERNLVMVTQTASGKTLGYNPAVFEYLSTNPGGHVLYIFPLNALMMDQMEKVTSLVEALQREKILITAEHLKGGMTPQQRDAIAQSCPNIVATNPEMLGFMLDRASGPWREFFAGVKYIVVDEVHTYRGLLGVHMTGIVRRLLLTARGLGADPHFILSSATVSNPLDLASRLTSLPESDFDLLGVDADGSQQANKHWLLLNPDWGSHGSQYANYQEVAAEVFVEMLTARNVHNSPSSLNTILFCRSIREVKSMRRLVDQRLDQRAPGLKSQVKSYVSAELTIDAKREIYDGLRTGRYRGVISTNALEAGIDIGRLDACIIAGFPFSVMALRQMAGRVGRKEEGVVFFIPYPLSSLDLYYRDHPDHLLEQPPEVFVVDPQNLYIARKHINAAAYPGGVSESDLRKYWGDRGISIARQAQQDRVMRFTSGRWIGTKRNFQDQDDVYAVNNIRSNVQRPYVVCPEGTPDCQVRASCFAQNNQECRSRITLLDRQYVYRDCHPGAVYESTDRRLFRVTNLDDHQRAVKVKELPEDSLERTFVEADVEIVLNGEPRAKKTMIPGVDMAWGDATVTRLFTGFFRYDLQPARRCRRCRKEYDQMVESCPICHHATELFYNRSRAERQDFPAPYQNGFSIVLKTVASWLTIRPDLETRLEACSPCKLPGEQNRVLAWLRQPLRLERLPARLHLSDVENAIITRYYEQASQQLVRTRPTQQETLLFPGIYGQCLMSDLRKQVAESRALEVFEAVTGYPVTDDLRHICRKCQRSVLLPAMHTLEHAVDARYPSVALGDHSDIGAYTTLGHAATGLPTIFWYDNYEGGLGAAEKIYEQIGRLLETGLEVLQGCSCSTLEGCPRCTYIPDCAGGNSDLSKPAGSMLISFVLNQAVPSSYRPFVYRKKRAAEFDKAYHENETSAEAHGWGEESPEMPLADPYELLRLQRQVHEIVAHKAFEARSREIVDETPPISAGQLNDAYQAILRGPVLQNWQIRQGVTPYEILEVLPKANLKMIQQVHRIIALQVHPDTNPERVDWANEMMKYINHAYELILKEKADRRK